jgi:hypothetical protein
MHTWQFSLVPFHIVPYSQGVEFTNPMAPGMEESVDVTGSRDITLMAFNTWHTENAKSCGASIIDTILY